MDGTQGATNKDQTFTPEEVSEIQSDLLAVKQETDMSWDAIGKEAGVPAGTISVFANGKYTGNNQRVGREVQIWLDSRKEKAATASLVKRSPSWQATQTGKEFLEILKFAQTLPDIVVVAGSPGVGKTITAEQYAQNNPNVYLVTMEPCTSTVNTMMNAIAITMGVSEKSQSRLSGAIGAKVREASALIIVDEAQHLSRAALDQLRTFHDRYGAGIALMGNQDVYSQLEGGKRETSFAQLFSRVGMRSTKSKPASADVCMILDAWEVPNELRKTLKAIAGKPGALRLLDKTLKVAHILASGSESPLRKEHITAAFEKLSSAGQRD